MSHIEEFKARRTIHGWTEEEAELHENIFIRLALKEAKGLINKREKMALMINDLLSYNNVMHINPAEIFAKVDEMLKL